MTDDNNPTDDNTAKGVPLLVPDLGENVTEATVVWIARAGDHVNEAQPIVILSLDKIDIELDAPASGMLELQRTATDIVKVGDVVARIVPAPPPDEAIERRHAELYGAIVADPEDDGARQVYADFLLAATAPMCKWGAETVALRGEYLSLVTRLRRPRAGDDVAALAKRRDELEPVARSTAKSLVPIKDKLIVEDGFVVGLDATLWAHVAQYKTLRAHAPMRSLCISNLDATWVEPFLALPRLEQLRALELVGRSRDRAETKLATRILASPRLANVQALTLRGLVLGDDGFALHDRRFGQLTIVGTGDWSEHALRTTIARSSHVALFGGGPCAFDVTGLERLQLGDYKLDDRASGLLASPSLRELELIRCTFRDLDALFALVDKAPEAMGAIRMYRCTVGNAPVERYADELAEREARVVFDGP